MQQRNLKVVFGVLVLALGTLACGCYRSVVQSDFHVKGDLEYHEATAWHLERGTGYVTAFHARVWFHAFAPTHSAEVDGERVTLKLTDLRPGATFEVPSPEASAIFQKGALNNSTKYECTGRLTAVSVAPETLTLALDLRYKRSETVESLLVVTLDFTRDKLPEALQDYDKVLRVKRDSADLYLARAKLHRAAGFKEASVSDYSEALRLAPRDWPRRTEVEAVLRELTRP